MSGCDKCSCNGKVETKSTEDDKPNNTPPVIRFQFCDVSPPLSQEADGFQLLIDSGPSNHFIGLDLIRGVESRMLKYTMMKTPMGITAARNNVLRGTAQGILLVVVHGTYDALRTVKLLVVLVPGLKKNYFRVRPQLRKASKQSLNRRVYLSILEPLVFN